MGTSRDHTLDPTRLQTQLWATWWFLVAPGEAMADGAQALAELTQLTTLTIGGYNNLGVDGAKASNVERLMDA